jgi:hypothetical protein
MMCDWQLMICDWQLMIFFSFQTVLPFIREVYAIMKKEYIFIAMNLHICVSALC